MKTTFDIPESLLRDVQALAREQKTTAKSLVEQALRKLLDEYEKAPTFKLSDASVGGSGLTPEFANASWEQIRDEIYRGRGA
jgi:phage portal protein BeeE